MSRLFMTVFPLWNDEHLGLDKEDFAARGAVVTAHTQA
jgi:hypothetical protein